MDAEFDTTTFFSEADFAARQTNRQRTWIKAQKSMAGEYQSGLEIRPVPSAHRFPAFPARELTAANTPRRKVVRTSLKQVRLPRHGRRNQDRGITCIALFLGTLIVSAGLVLFDRAWSLGTLTAYWRGFLDLCSSIL
jgi:hypothetical protein